MDLGDAANIADLVNDGHRHYDRHGYGTHTTNEPYLKEGIASLLFLWKLDRKAKRLEKEQDAE